jgi:hypothetical protein
VRGKVKDMKDADFIIKTDFWRNELQAILDKEIKE